MGEISIWGVSKTQHLASHKRSSFAKVQWGRRPSGTGKCWLRRGNCRWAQCITELCASPSCGSHDPSTGCSAQQSKETGNVPLLIESGWHRELHDTRLWDFVIPNYNYSWTFTPTAGLLPSPPHCVCPPIYNQPLSCWRVEWSPLLILYTSSSDQECRTWHKQKS